MAHSDIQCRVRELDHLVLTVSSIPETVRFYTQVLGMRGQQFDGVDGGKSWALRFGQSKIDLHQKGRATPPTAAYQAPGSADLCFLTDAPIDDWLRHLKIHGVAVELGPVARTGTQSALTSLFIRDGDGNLIEISVAAL